MATFVIALVYFLTQCLRGVRTIDGDLREELVVSLHHQAYPCKYHLYMPATGPCYLRPHLL
jgi:hypothetical protein